MTTTPQSSPATVQFATLAHHLEEQIRGSTDGAAVNRYRLAMQNGEDFPPLLVAEVAGALVLVDGFHRRDALEALGRDEAPARIVPCQSLKEARWLGFDANLRHGQPLKAKLLRPALRAYIDAGKNRGANGRLQSYRDLASELPGVSYGTIRRWIETDYPALFLEMGGAEGAAPGGCYDLPRAPTAEEIVEDTARGYIAEARALLVGLPGVARWRVAKDLEALAGVLSWDAEDGGEPGLASF